MNPREHGLALLRCFEKYVADRDDPVNRAHARVAAEWVRLLDEAEPRLDDIDALVTAVDHLGEAGSATLDLSLGVRHWADRARRAAIMRRRPLE